VKAGHISRVTTGWDTYQEYLRLNGTEQPAIETARGNGWPVELFEVARDEAAMHKTI
jgi:hypothetical protein